MWWDEYRYRSKFGGSHDEYIDTPGDAIAWLNGIDAVVVEVREEKARDSK